LWTCSGFPYLLSVVVAAMTQIAISGYFAHLGGLFGGWLGVQYFRGRGLFGKR